MGGSMGGMQVLEWGALLGDFVRVLVPMSCGARHTAWQVAISDVQRKAIAADPRWAGGRYDPKLPPLQGLSLARQMAMITYVATHARTHAKRRACCQSSTFLCSALCQVPVAPRIRQEVSAGQRGHRPAGPAAV